MDYRQGTEIRNEKVLLRRAESRQRGLQERWSHLTPLSWLHFQWPSREPDPINSKEKEGGFIWRFKSAFSRNFLELPMLVSHRNARCWWTHTTTFLSEHVSSYISETLARILFIYDPLFKWAYMFNKWFGGLDFQPVSQLPEECLSATDSRHTPVALHQYTQMKAWNCHCPQSLPKQGAN